MSDEVLVTAEGVSKKFCRSLKRSLWYGVQDVASEVFGRKGYHDALRKNEFWALDDISFELKRGECLGLIGPNGAGKSTLLKMLNGLVKPDKGRIAMRGRVGALIELGAGFNPILTARENIYINGSVLGFTKKEIDGKFDAIVDFAGIGAFIDTPVQSYSSGMKVRLGFAVAAQMDPDVLLIDEVLAVGDAAFRTKCLGLMAELSREAAMIFVSHSMPLMGRMSNKAILINDGRRVLETYDVPKNILEYHGLNVVENTFVIGDEGVSVKSVTVMSEGQAQRGDRIVVTKFSDVSISFEFEIREDIGDFMFNVIFFDREEKGVAETFSPDQGFYVTSRKGRVTATVSFKRFCLNPGRYSLGIGIIERKPDGSRGIIYYSHRGLINLSVTGETIGYTPVQLDCDWYEGQFEQ